MQSSQWDGGATAQLSPSRSCGPNLRLAQADAQWMQHRLVRGLASLAVI